LIKEEIENFYTRTTPVLDSSEMVAQAVQNYLSVNQLLNNASPHHSFLVSDYTHSFEMATQLFFRQKVNLEKYPLWN
jgi:glutamate racemase